MDGYCMAYGKFISSIILLAQMCLLHYRNFYIPEHVNTRHRHSYKHTHTTHEVHVYKHAIVFTQICQHLFKSSVDNCQSSPVYKVQYCCSDTRRDWDNLDVCLCVYMWCVCVVLLNYLY